MPLMFTGTAVKGRMETVVTSEQQLTPLVPTGTAVKGKMETGVAVKMQAHASRAYRYSCERKHGNRG